MTLAPVSTAAGALPSRNVITSLIRHAAESWHPKIRQDRTSLASLRSAESEFQRVVQRHLAALMRTALSQFEGYSFTPGNDPDHQAEQFVASLEHQIEPQRQEFAKALQPAYLRPFELGAKSAFKDLPKGYKFADPASSAVLDTTWSLVDPDVTDYVNTQSMSLVQNLTSTTMQKMRSQMSQGIQNLETRNEIADRLSAVADDIPDWRARLIAQTETIRAHSAGLKNVYDKSGIVTGYRWLDGQPQACPICSDLNGQIVTEWDIPPAHPGCRCTISPVIGSIEGELEELDTAPEIVKDWGEIAGFSVKTKKMLNDAETRMVNAVSDREKAAAMKQYALAVREAYKEAGFETIWNGSMYQTGSKEYAGVKLWDCSIGIGAGISRTQAPHLMHVVNHEMAHAMKNFNPTFYGSPGLQWAEEASAEVFSKQFGKRIEALGITTRSTIYKTYEGAVKLFEKLAEKQGITSQELAFRLKKAEVGNTTGDVLHRYEILFPGLPLTEQAKILNMMSPQMTANEYAAAMDYLEKVKFAKR